MYLTILSNHVRFDAIKSEKNCKFFLKKQDPTFCTATSSTPALPLQSSLVSLSRNCTASSATSSITAAGKRVRSVEVTSFSLSLALSLSLSLSLSHTTPPGGHPTHVLSPRHAAATPPRSSLRPLSTWGPTVTVPRVSLLLQLGRTPHHPRMTESDRQIHPSATPRHHPRPRWAGPGRTEREASKRN